MPTNTIIRVHRRERYTIVSNILIEDASLTWKATALLVYLLSRPDDWETSPRHLATVKKCGIKSVYSGLRELKEAGYIEHTYIRDEQGRILKGLYIVHEEPIPVKATGGGDSCPHSPKGNAPRRRDAKRPLPNTERLQKTDDDKAGLPSLISDQPPVQTQQPAAAVLDESVINDLIDRVPTCHRNGAVKAVLIRGLEAYSPEYVEQAVQYTCDNARNNFKAYLGKTIEFGWGEGYPSKETAKQDAAAIFLESRRQMPADYLEYEAARGCKACAQVLQERI